MTKKLLIIFVLALMVGLFGMNCPAQAADVTFSEISQISLSGLSDAKLNVSAGGTCSTIAVGTNTVTLTFASGEELTLSSPDRYTMATDAVPPRTQTCGSASTLDLGYGSDGASVVVTITASACTPPGGGGSSAGPVITAPAISSIAAVPGSTTATITWTTDKVSDSTVLYGTTTAYGLTKTSSTSTASHSLALTGLTASTVYHYKVQSSASGATGVSADQTFTTLAATTTPVTPVVPVTPVTPVTPTTPTTTTTTTGITLAPAKPMSEMTTAELQAEITRLLGLITQIKAMMAEIFGTTTTGISCAITSFSRNLSLGMSGDDVKCLQKVLNSSADTAVAVTGLGSSGNETNFFGVATKAAVVKFQNKYVSEILAPYGLTAGNGFVGSSTRTKLNSLLR